MDNSFRVPEFPLQFDPNNFTLLHHWVPFSSFTVFFRQVGHVTFSCEKTVTSDSQQSISHNSTTKQHFSTETIPNDAEKLTGGHHQQPSSTQ
jgi:hypothetical protein